MAERTASDFTFECDKCHQSIAVSDQYLVMWNNWIGAVCNECASEILSDAMDWGYTITQPIKDSTKHYAIDTDVNFRW